MIIEVLEHVVDACFAIMPQKKPAKEVLMQAKIIAHRGAHDHALGIIENTMDAFRRALNAGCWGIELDVRTTLDGILVVHHDPTLMRLWKQDVAISALTFEELRSIQPAIPTLAEVADAFGGLMHLFIELKAPFNAQTTLQALLQTLKPVQDYHLLSLDEPIIKRLDAFPKECLLLVPYYNNVQRFCDLSIQEGYGGVLGSYLLLGDRYIKALRQAHQVYGVGFVDSKNSLYRELNRGIFWIFSNQSIKLISIKQRMMSEI